MGQSKYTGRFPVFQERFRTLQGDLSTTDFSKKLGLSRATVGFYLNGNRIPDVETLLQICQVCEVSADYLLGITPNPTINKDVDAVCEFTGLSEQSVIFLHNTKKWGTGIGESSVIDTLIDDCIHHNLDERAKRSYRPILHLLVFFFRYTNAHVRKQVFIDGRITDRNRDDYISSSAIELNDIVVENAVLTEIQQALMNLKRSNKKYTGIDR